jgi:lipopolysaccharide export system protein LptA
MSRRRLRRPLAGLPVALLFPAAFAVAAAEDGAPRAVQPAKQAGPFSEFSLTTKNEPIHVRARDLEFLYKDKRIIYRGAVVATQGESTLKSDTLTVTYEEGAPADAAARPAANGGVTRGQRIKEIVAEGNVEITSENRRATSRRAVFNEDARTVVLRGDAVLREDANQVSGETVTVYIDEDRVVVEGGPDRKVMMDLFPRQQGNSGKDEKKETKSRK